MRERRCRPVAFVAGALAALSCGDLDPFQCVGDAQCRRGNEEGTCTVVGYCAYPDDMCPSGMRFSPDAAQAIASECTEPQLPGTDDAGSSGGASSPGSSGTGEVDESDGESTSPAPMPSCGDGEVQEGEECDDGNDARADGCNPDCRESGQKIGEFFSERPDADVAWDMLLWEGDIVIVGHAVVADEGTDLFAARYSPAGVPVWEQTWSGSAQRDDRFYAVARSPGGALLAGGSVVPAASSGTTPRPQFWIGELDPDTGLSVWDDRDGDAPPSSDQVWDLIAPANDTVVVTGRVGTVSSADFVVRSYSTTGGALTQQWTTSFSGAASTSDWGYALTLDADGRVVAGGATHATTVDVDRWLEVFLPDGSAPAPPCVDDGTGADGRVPDGNDQIRGLALAPDGRIAATGFATKSEAEKKDAWIALYEPEACETVWQKTVIGKAHDDDEGRAIAVDDDGTIVTVGYIRDGNTDDVWIEKRSAEGEWLWDARVNGLSGDGNDVGTAVAIDDDHEVVVAGYVITAGGADAWVGRYTP